ncbi:MAG: class I SAM-dependent methyltransferase [Carnobacterium sp.]|nr:class I SAM-dependent methyltransferase [Carnobacterium sp.]
MSQKEIERLFSELDTSVQLLQKELGVSYLEGLSETGENIVDGRSVVQDNNRLSDQAVQLLTTLYQELSLGDMNPEEIRKSFQLALLKGTKSDQIQANHQMTPDAIGFILAYLIEKVIDIDSKKIRLLDPAIGTGNLLSTIYNSLTLKKIEVEAEGIDNDDLLLSLASINFELQGQKLKLTHQDALTDLLLDPVDVVVSDLPVGFYPIDENAKRFKTSSNEGHSYAHHLFIEQSIYYLKDSGYGVFLVPTQLFESKESAALTKMIQSEAFLQGMLHLPKELFKSEESRKSILLVQKKGDKANQAKQVLLAQIPDFKNQTSMQHFMQEVEKWKQENIKNKK